MSSCGNWKCFTLIFFFGVFSNSSHPVEQSLNFQAKASARMKRAVTNCEGAFRKYTAGILFSFAQPHFIFIQWTVCFLKYNHLFYLCACASFHCCVNNRMNKKCVLLCHAPNKSDKTQKNRQETRQRAWNHKVTPWKSDDVFYRLWKKQ